MNWPSYKKFEQDLFAKNYGKEALIIDVRNNGGGNIHDYLIETLTRQTYALNSHRNYDGSLYAGPANSWEKPMVLLINQDSFSDAEIFPNLFSELQLGKVIGMPTSGSVIGTNHYRFRDGSSMRMPGHGWFTKDGTNMEGSGAQPDIFVDPTPHQIIEDDDVQLKRAVQELLEEL
jgi:tricorn protease